MDLKQLKAFVENPSIELICHNAQFEWKWFLSRGINANIKYDTRIEAKLIDSRTPGDLGTLSMKAGVDKYYKDESPATLEGKALEQRPTRDARNTLALHELYYSQLSDAEKKIYHEVLVPAAKTLAQIELEGLCIDPKRVEKMWAKLDADIKGLKLDKDPAIAQFQKSSGKPFNVGSSVHKNIIIFDMLGYAPVAYHEETNTPVMDAESLECMIRLQHIHERHSTGIELKGCKKCQSSTLMKILRASQWTGWRDKFLGTKKDLKTGEAKGIWRHIVEVGGKHFIFTDLMAVEARTGRVISMNPNTQNMPNNFVRVIFTSRYGWIIEFDYKGIELRIWACLAGDSKLIEAFRTGDPHVDTAQDICAKKTISDDERFVGKTFNYIIINGGGPDRLAQLTGLPLNETQQMFKRFWREHPSGRSFWEEWVEAESYDKYDRPRSGIVYAPTGMKRYFEKPNEARNHLIQNPAMIVLLKALNQAVPYVKDEFKGKACIDLTIHDSIRADASGSIKKRLIHDVKKIMESQTLEWFDGHGKKIEMELPFLAEVKAGRDWGSMKELK